MNKQSDYHITDEQKKELDRRLERIKKGETKFFTWEEVKANLRKKIK